MLCLQKGKYMKKPKRLTKFLTGILVLVFTILGTGIEALPVNAASGTVYTAVIHPCYAHPVTGAIEDSGGEASYATGQGMVDGAVYTSGILEVTDSGEYYLTIRMSLMDYTSNHSFMVQNVGDSGWSSPSMGVTGNGSDNNGSTADICIQVPSENCVVRGSMYVTPMGRDVVFYLYPSDYAAGNNTDMNATMVTSSGAAAPGNASSGQSAAGGALSSGAGALQSNAAGNTAGNAAQLQSSITQAAQPTAQQGQESEGETSLNKEKGLGLSTEEETEEESGFWGASEKKIIVLFTAITISGLIFLGAGAGIVYLFRKNWYRWSGGGYSDDDEWQIR